MEEVWKDVDNYEGYYQVSNLGRVRSVTRMINSSYNSTRIRKGRILVLTNDSAGYPSLRLTKNNVGETVRVHTLVAKAFIPNPFNKPCIDHINTIRNDNKVENLRWVTHKENCNNIITKERVLRIVKSPGFREQARQQHLGEKNPMFGRIEEKHPNYGKRLSDKTKEKIRSANSLKRIKVVQLDLNNNVLNVFDSLRDASIATGARVGNISKCCQEKSKTAKGFKWKYYETFGRPITKISSPLV